MISFTPARLSFVSAGAAALLACAGCSSPAPATPPAASAPAAPARPADPLASLSYAGTQAPVEALDRDLAAAGNDPARLAPIAHRLTALLRDPAATFAARQAACQRLGALPASVVLAGDGRTVLAAMLLEDTQVNLARLALESTPGGEVDALFLAALSRSAGAPRLALIQSIGNRRIAAGVKPLAKLLRDTDPATAGATAVALGQIGTSASLAALDAAPRPSAPAIVEARLVAAGHLGGDAAVRVYSQLADDTQAPAPLRAAAFHELLRADPARASARIVAALAGADAARKAVALETVATLPAPDLVAALDAGLPSWDVPTQVATLSALGRRGDVAAVPALVAATRSADAAIRSAAIDSLGRVPGSPDTAAVLARLIASAPADDAKLARQSLARLDGSGVAAAIRSGAAAGEPALRIVYLEQLALRNMAEDLPLLLRMRADPDAAIRAAALGAIGDLAPGSAQSAILEWARDAADPAEQARALRALAAVSLRLPDVSARARLVTDAIEQAPAAVAIRLLPVLPRIGGEAGAAAAARLALRPDPALARAAVGALARWGDATGLESLVTVADSLTDESLRSTAVDGAIRLIERNRALASDRLTAAVARLLPRVSTDPLRLRLVRLLGRGTDETALALATRLQSDPVLALEAGDAALSIVARRTGAPTARASDGWADPAVDDNPRTAWGVPAAAGQWIEIDYQATRAFHLISLEQGPRPDNFPERCEVYVTDDPAQPGAVRATVAGQSTRTVITLPAGTRGRYLILRNTVERRSGWWSIGDLLID